MSIFLAFRGKSKLLGFLVETGLERTQLDLSLQLRILVPLRQDYAYTYGEGRRQCYRVEVVMLHGRFMRVVFALVIASVNVRDSTIQPSIHRQKHRHP